MPRMVRAAVLPQPVIVGFGPVVSRANARIMLGVVTLTDILKAYGVERAEELDYTDHPDL